MTAAFDIERLDILCDEITDAIDAVETHKDIGGDRLFDTIAELGKVATRIKDFTTQAIRRAHDDG